MQKRWNLHYPGNKIYRLLPPGVLSSCLVNHCHYSVSVSFLFYFFFSVGLCVSVFYFFSVGKFFKTISLDALAFQALWQSFGCSVGSWGFGNVLANRQHYKHSIFSITPYFSAFSSLSNFAFSFESSEFESAIWSLETV